MSAEGDNNVTELAKVQSAGSGNTVEPALAPASAEEQKNIQGHLMANWAGKTENANTQAMKMSLRRKYTIDAQRKAQIENEAQRVKQDKVIRERLEMGVNEDGTPMSFIDRFKNEQKISSASIKKASFKKSHKSDFQKFWMSDFELEKDHPDQREQWNSRWSFVLAAIGSAVGLGNFWRFPFLTYKHGGAIFFVPYLLSLIFLGIPLMIMEFGIGQLASKGSAGSFRIIHKRLPGIGYASAFASFVVAVYYIVILGHALIYFVYSFMSPMPWAGWKTDFQDRCTEPDISRAEEIYNIDILKYYDKTCKEYEEGDPSTFSLPSFFASLAVWVIVYFSVMRGIRTIQYVIWGTVPLPFLFLIVLIIKNATLPGASSGISKYLAGEGVATVTEASANYQN